MYSLYSLSWTCAPSSASSAFCSWRLSCWLKMFVKTFRGGFDPGSAASPLGSAFCSGPWYSPLAARSSSLSVYAWVYVMPREFSVIIPRDFSFSSWPRAPSRGAGLLGAIERFSAPAACDSDFPVGIAAPLNAPVSLIDRPEQSTDKSTLCICTSLATSLECSLF